jgi:hypothetical protein
MSQEKARWEIRAAFYLALILTQGVVTAESTVVSVLAVPACSCSDRTSFLSQVAAVAFCRLQDQTNSRERFHRDCSPDASG